MSRARRIVENAFGILANRFTVFLSPMSVTPQSAEKIVLASCLLHNYLRTESPSRYTPSGTCDRESIASGVVTPGDWRNEGNCFQPLAQQSGNRYSQTAKDVREQFSEYFNTTGQVPWQDNAIS